MKAETVKCGECGAPLDIDAAIDLVDCEYCGFQSKLTPTEPEGPRANGPKLAETLALQVTEDLAVKIVFAGAVLPVVTTKVLGTSRAQQDSFTFIVRSGNAKKPVDNRLIGEFKFPLKGPAVHRGAEAAGMTLRITEDGSLSISIKEKGVDNRMVKAGMSVEVTP